MACSLPQFIFLKSNKNDKYLRYRKENDATHACLEFSGDAKQENVEIQYVKFEVQKSETLEGFVHIRSSYNNKYWVRKCGGEEEKKKWIAVEANEAEEDPSKLSCTLFKPVGVGEQDGEQDKGQKIRLVHIDQEGQQGCVAPADSDLLTLAAGLVDKDEDDGDVFIAYNAASTFILPEYVALTNHEGKYDGAVELNSVQFVDFNTSDIGRCMVMQPVQYPLANPPYIEFRYPSPINARWAMGGAELVWNQPIGTNLTPNLDVTPIPLGGNQIAFRPTVNSSVIPNALFLKCLPNMFGAVNLLAPHAASIVADARFGVVEPVLRREISEVRYAVEDSRVYNVGSLDKFTDERWNTSSVEQTGSFSVSYTDSRSTTWGDSVSLTTGVTASISASIPYVGVSLGVELSEERTQTVEFGKEVSSEETVAYVQNLTIPPGKKHTLSVIATRGLCDVPFTCQVIDTLTNGTVRRYTKLDGLFTGANEFGFKTIVTEVAI